jgi:DNA gyrase subunit A
MDGTNIIPVNIEDEMKGSYLDYAMSVIVGRALPDIRDGLKPVHRRILYAMLREGLTANKRYSKCAGVVGEVLKHYHPHGDGPVYGSLVRMAQPWNLRYPLIDGQGNFGSIDGDNPAAYRYTECKMFAIAEMLLADIDQDTVEFVPNFDESTSEPVVLPSRVPNLLINGAEGIAVGMASSIPPHNLTEVINATIHLIENPDATVEDLMKHVPGPDFPTGGAILGSRPIREMYATGRGLLQVRGKYHVEQLKGAKRETEAIIIDEVPYQTNKAKLFEKIAELVNEKKIEGISKMRDESDRKGMRIVFELKKDAVADVVINQILKFSAFQKTYGVILLAIVNGQPKVLSLREMLSEFIEHRRTVIIRRTRFQLNKALARVHLLEGLRRALENLDAIIELIKKSESPASAKEQLQVKYSFSDIQAQHVLDLPLKKLTSLERRGIEEEYLELMQKIERFNVILGSAQEVDTIAKQELLEIAEKFGDKRRTEIEHDGGADINIEDIITEEDMMVLISHRGYAKRCQPSLYRAQRRGGKGIQGTKKLTEDDEDFVTDIFIASTHAYLLVFTSEGKLHWLKVYNLPEAGRTARGRAIVNILELGDQEHVSTIVPVREFSENRFVIMATQKGYIKRVDLMEFSNVRRGGIRAVTIDEGDKLIGVHITEGKSDCIISTRSGMAIRFDENDVRVMGRTARGVTAVQLDDDDVVVNLVTVPHEVVENVEAKQDDVALLTVCENGYGKRTSISEYRCQGRAGKGLIDIKTTDRNGPVIGMILSTNTDEVMIITNAGKIIRVPVSSISLIGRNTQGVRLINLDESERVAAIGKIAESKDDDVLEEEKAPDGNHYQ